jgi:hypothetical protein
MRKSLRLAAKRGVVREEGRSRGRIICKRGISGRGILLVGGFVEAAAVGFAGRVLRNDDFLQKFRAVTLENWERC